MDSTQMDHISYTPVPCVCSGEITSKLTDTETYEVVIKDSPLGEMNGPIYSELAFSPGSDGNFKPGDRVKVLMVFTFGGADSKFVDVMPTAGSLILGLYNEKTMSTKRIENPISADEPGIIRFLHPEGFAGMVASKTGYTKLVTSSGMYTMLKPGGFGVNQELNYSVAQNFRRSIGRNDPGYFACDHFGMYSGITPEDQSAKLDAIDHKIVYRRFVQQTKSFDNWVSTCEGTFAPFVGINVEEGEVEEGKSVLYTKIVNFKSSETQESRATIEMGEPGESFINVRVDDVIVGEGHSPITPGATPAVLGNRFKLMVSDAGAVDLRVAGEGIPESNMNALHLSIDKEGNLTIHAKGKIKLSHGDDDEETNSIVMDPEKGIDITAVNGFRVNKQEVVLQAWADFFKKFQAQWVQVTAIGAPAIIHPAIAAEFNTLMDQFGQDGGFTSIGEGPKAAGVIQDDDGDFSSIG